MKLGKAKNSHDTIQYAINGWATFALFDFDLEQKEIQKYYDIKIKLFNIISELFAGSINLESIEDIRSRTIDCLIEHSALFPPSESTYALHEIMHVIEQVENIGPPRYNSLYMFERANLYLKRMIKNRNHPFASMVKSYSTQEFVTQAIGYHFTKMLNIINLFSFIPTDLNIIKKVLSSFQNIYVDLHNTIYCLPNLRIHALKGKRHSLALTSNEKNQLSEALGNVSRDGSVLGNYLLLFYC